MKRTYPHFLIGAVLCGILGYFTWPYFPAFVVLAGFSLLLGLANFAGTLVKKPSKRMATGYVMVAGIVAMFSLLFGMFCGNWQTAFPVFIAGSITMVVLITMAAFIRGTQP